MMKRTAAEVNLTDLEGIRFPKKQKPEPKTTVVHLKMKGGKVIQNCDVYIGRKCTLGGWDLPNTKWGNPYRLTEFGGDVSKILDAYKHHVQSKPELMKALIPELKGKRLGCWCVPKPCHGNVLIALIEEMEAKERSKGRVEKILEETKE